MEIDPSEQSSITKSTKNNNIMIKTKLKNKDPFINKDKFTSKFQNQFMIKNQITSSKSHPVLNEINIRIKN